jgi:hypothetical protein
MKCRLERPRWLTAFLLAGPLLFASAEMATAWETQAVIDVLPGAALVPTTPGAPLMQAETTAIRAQGALSHSQALGEGIALSGTAWAMADTLPSSSPLDTPDGKVDIESRILELRAAWEIIPGALIWSAGKSVIHPSSGFFKAPLNVMSRGGLDAADQSGAAVGKWEEGWIGTEITWLWGDITLSDFLSPRITWSSDADKVLRYVSRDQGEFQNLARVGLHIGDVDVRVLGLLTAGGPGSSESLHVQLGTGLDANVGDSITVRAEASVADARDRLEVTDDTALLSTTKEVAWAPRALVGMTWASSNELTVMAEYYYNGLGFSGSDYGSLIRYTRTRRDTGSSAADVIDQFGTFEAGRHYGFARIAGTVDQDLTAEGWVMTNLQDLSSITGVALTLTHDTWGLSGSLMNAWGGDGTEAGVSPLLWRLDLAVNFYL